MYLNGACLAMREGYETALPASSQVLLAELLAAIVGTHIRSYIR